jgi:hypothetical protein
LPKKNEYMKSEDGWWILGSAARPRLLSNGKGSLKERKDDTNQSHFSLLDVQFYALTEIFCNFPKSMKRERRNRFLLRFTVIFGKIF